MKKLILGIAIASFGLFNAQSGNFKLGAHIGLPVSDAADVFSFYPGIDVAYLWPVSTNFNLGLTTGYTAWMVKSEFDSDPYNVIPIAATADYKIAPQFSLGLDLGYGIIFVDGFSDGGFYFQPKAAYHFGPNQVYLGFVGLTREDYVNSAINLGYAYTFGK